MKVSTLHRVLTAVLETHGDMECEVVFPDNGFFNNAIDELAQAQCYKEGGKRFVLTTVRAVKRQRRAAAAMDLMMKGDAR